MKIHIQKKNFYLTLGVVLLAISFALYFWHAKSCQDFKIESYQQNDEDDRIILTMKGRHFGPLGEVKVYINDRKIGEGYMRKWSDNEIQMFIRKPFTYALVQLKKGNEVSQYIPVWNTEYLPQVRQRLQIQGFPVLESYQLLSNRPPILEIRGQNFGFRYQNQLLLFNRQLNNSSNVYFEASALDQYRILKPSEILFWGKQLIRLQLPQEVAEGPIFLVRLAGNKLQSSNSLYISAAPNRRFQQAGGNKVASTHDTTELRLVLRYPAGMLPDPVLFQVPTQTQVLQSTLDPKGKAGVTSLESYAKFYDKVLAVKDQAQDQDQDSAANLRAKWLQLRWPRNEFNQRWHNLELAKSLGSPAGAAPKGSSPKGLLDTKDTKDTKDTSRQLDLRFPARYLKLEALPQSLTQDFKLATRSWLLQTLETPSKKSSGTTITPLPERALYLDFSYDSWQQSPPESSRNQAYNAQELEQLRYLAQRNRAMIVNYQVPHWELGQFGDNLKKRNLSPYWKAMELYKRAVSELELQNKFLPTDASPSLQWLYSPVDSYEQATSQLSRWPKDSPSSPSSSGSPSSPESQGVDIPEHDAKALAPEQVLLLLLRSMTEMGISARIIAGSISEMPVGQSQLDEVSLSAYYWLEIYLPEFGWFQIDPLAEILAYGKDPANWGNNTGPHYWGSLEPSPNQGESSTSPSPSVRQIKLAFGVLGEFWQSFDSTIAQATSNSLGEEETDSIGGFSWRLHRLK